MESLKRKNIVEILVILMMFTGCASEDIPAVTNEASEVIATIGTESETVIETSVQETESSIIEEPVETLPPRTQEMIDAAWNERLNYNGSGADNIPVIDFEEVDMDWGYIYRICLDDDAYPGLSEAVQQEQQIGIDYINDVDSSFIVRQYKHKINRCDNRVLSIRDWIFMADAVDGGERISDVTYHTWDYSGQELNITDVVTDFTNFVQVVMPLIADAIPEASNVDINEVIEGLIHSNPDDIDFYLTSSTLNFVCHYYDDTQGAVVPVIIRVNYREYADLFNPEYLPGDGLMLSDAYLEERYLGNLTNRIDFYRHDQEYDSPEGCDWLVSNYRNGNYMIVCYSSSRLIHERADGIYNTDTPRYLIVLYDADSCEEIGSQEVDNLTSFCTNTDAFSLDTILNFVAALSNDV